MSTLQTLMKIFSFLFFSSTTFLVHLHFRRSLLGQRLAFVPQLQLRVVVVRFRRLLHLGSHHSHLLYVCGLRQGQRTKGKEQSSDLADAPASLLINHFILPSWPRLHLKKVEIRH